MISEIECLVDAILEYRPENFREPLVKQFSQDTEWNYEALFRASYDELQNLYKMLNESNYYS
jgi:hypothetical protein